jgi:hypothetical protein
MNTELLFCQEVPLVLWKINIGGFGLSFDVCGLF